MSNDTILVLAASGRMLAQSARRAGLNPLVIDLFGDEDTRVLAEEYHLVHHLGPAQISKVIDHYIDRYAVRNAVYGSGVETCPGSLELLKKKLNLYGNEPEPLIPLLDKKQFFKWLEVLKIDYPEVSFDADMKESGWLMKPLASEGGFGIKRQKETDQPGTRCLEGGIEKPVYWQRHVDGVPMSALFLSNKKSVRVLGFNRQWTQRDSFVFSGVMTQACLPERYKVLFRGWIRELARVFALKGLNSLDFIWDGNRCWVLEINPRPSASMVLYDDEFDKGLLFEHIKACNGRPISSGNRPGKIKACQILYSKTEQRAPGGIEWPDWCMDRPAAGALIRKNHPICSIMASGSRSSNVYNQLQERQQIMINKFKGIK